MTADRETRIVTDAYGHTAAEVVYDPEIGGADTPWVVVIAEDYRAVAPTAEAGVVAAEDALDNDAEAFFFPRVAS